MDYHRDLYLAQCEGVRFVVLPTTHMTLSDRHYNSREVCRSISQTKYRHTHRLSGYSPIPSVMSIAQMNSYGFSSVKYCLIIYHSVVHVLSIYIYLMLACLRQIVSIYLQVSPDLAGWCKCNTCFGRAKIHYCFHLQLELALKLVRIRKLITD